MSKVKDRPKEITAKIAAKEGFDMCLDLKKELIMIEIKARLDDIPGMMPHNHARMPYPNMAMRICLVPSSEKVRCFQEKSELSDPQEGWIHHPLHSTRKIQHSPSVLSERIELVQHDENQCFLRSQQSNESPADGPQHPSQLRLARPNRDQPRTEA